MESVQEANDRYLELCRYTGLPNIWAEVERTPDEVVQILNRFVDRPIFAIDEADQVAAVLEGLSNPLLFEFSRWLGSRLRQRGEEVRVVEDSGCAKLGKLIDQKYGQQFSVRASHFKQISRILKNSSVEYDLNWDHQS